MQKLFNSKNFYTKDILSGVVDESKLTFLRNNLQRYIYISYSFNATRTRPSNAERVIRTIRESKKDEGKMRDLTGILGEINGVNLASGYFEYGGDSESIAWLLSNNHTSLLPSLSWSPQEDMYFLTDPFSALKLVQFTSVQARKLTSSDENLKRLMKDFSSTNSNYINTLYNEDDLRMLATKACVKLNFNRCQFNENQWINDYDNPVSEKINLNQELSNIELLVSKLTEQKASPSQTVLKVTLHQMKKSGEQLSKNNPLEQIVQFMRDNEISIIVDVTPYEIKFNDGKPLKLSALKRSFDRTAKGVNFK